MEQLKAGSTGPTVERVQQRLSAKGYRLTADGVYGHRTETAVRDFQRAHGLLPDGIVGPRTDTQL